MQDKDIQALKARLAAVVQWLEKNQPDAFQRGLWDAVNEADKGEVSQRPAVDLSGLTRYECTPHCMEPVARSIQPDYGWYKASDVQELLSTANAAQAEPVRGAYLNNQGGVTLCQIGRERDGFGFASYLYANAAQAGVREPVILGVDYAADYLAEVRDAALEEAAKAVERMGDMNPPMSFGMKCADIIRALKSTPSPSVNSKEGGK